jgi:hypothetical protein
MNYESPYLSFTGRESRFADLLRRMENRQYAAAQVHTSTTIQTALFSTAPGTAGGTQTFVENTNGTWINGATVATTGEISGRGGGSVYLDHLPTLCYTIETGSSFADVRWWVGIGDGAFIGSDDIATAGDFIGFRASSTTDTNWYIFTADASTTTQAGYNTGVPITVSTRYDFVFVMATTTEGYGYIGTGADQPLAGPFPIAIPTGIVRNTTRGMYAVVENKANSSKAIRFGAFRYWRR